MKKLLGLLTLAVMLTLNPGAMAVAQTAKPAAKTVKPAVGANANDELIKLAAAGMSDDILLGVVAKTDKTKYDTSADALLKLKASGVSERVIAAILGLEILKQSAPAGTRETARVRPPDTSLTRDQAAEIIKRSDLFTSVDTTTVRLALDCSSSPSDPSNAFSPMRGESDADYFRRMQAEILNPAIPQQRAKEGSGVDALRSAGLIRSQDSAGCAGGRHGVVTVLTPQGTVASKQWRQTAANTWEVPTARRSIVAVTGIRAEGQLVVADFTWRWISPQNGIEAGARVVSAQGIFERYDDGWRLNTSRLRDYFFDGWGKLTVPPSYSANPNAVTTSSTGASPTAGPPAAQRATAANTPPPSLPSANGKGCFQVGSTVNEVTAAQGTPDGMDSEGKAMFYGTSRVYISDGRVARWALGTPALKTCDR